MIIVFSVWLCFSSPNDDVTRCDQRSLAVGQTPPLQNSVSPPHALLVT